MGIDINRFVGLSESLSKHLWCGICHNILDNAVITSCGHSFCEPCIKRSFDLKHKTCPECRKRLKRRSKDAEESDDLTLNDYLFARNYKINGIISELKIKCDFNGYQKSVELGHLLDHLKLCEHRFCKICGFIASKSSQHNCFELMKKDRDDWIRKFKKLEEENVKLKTRIQVLQEEHQYSCDFQDIA